MSSKRTAEASLAALVDALLEHPKAARAEWVAQLDVGEHTKQVLRQLIGDDTETQDWLDAGAVDMLAAPPTKTPGQLVGRYRLDRLIGDGGSSVVWLAHRDDTSRQAVAVKYLKSGLLTAATRERFLTEQQLLAKLSHPHIVQMLDVGISAENVPFLVMEFVDGENIVAHARALPVRQRLHVFLALASAVSFAHRNLILHRDIKPGNVMVTRAGVVKLLDFGIGRFLSSDADTATQQRALTPAYAAPEQFRHSTPSTSMDVFSLGAVLYELLCGQPPFASASRRGMAAHEPPPPSATLQAHDAAARALRQALTGDLDMIVLHAMRHDPAQRYASVDAMADDVRRYLDRRPIHARAPSWTYRTRRFVQRHRFGVAVSVLAIAFIVAAVGMVASAHRDMRQARNRAEQSLAFIESLFRNELREQPAIELPSTAELLDRGAARASIELANDPIGQVQVLSWIGRAYLASDRPSAAVQVFEQALQAVERSAQRDERARQDLQLSLWAAQLQAGVAPKAIRLAMADARIAQADPALRARYLELEASCLDAENRYADADALLHEALATIDTLSAPDAAERRARIWLARSQMASNQSRHAQAATHAQHALDAIATSPHATPKLRADAQVAKAMALVLQGDAHAEGALREALLFARSLSQASNLPSAQIENVLGNWLAAQGAFDEARALLTQSYETRQRLLGAQHVLTQDTFGDLLLLDRRMGRLTQAEQGYRQQLAVMTHTEQDTPARAAILKGNLADILIDLGQLDEAEALARDALNLRRASMGEFSVGPAYYYLWRIAMQREDLPGAQHLAQEAIAILDRGDAQSLERGLMVLCLADTQRQAGDLSAARRSLDDVLALHRDKLPGNHLRWGLIYLTEAQWQWDSGHTEQARQALSRAQPLFESGFYYHESKRQAYEQLRHKTKA